MLNLVTKLVADGSLANKKSTSGFSGANEKKSHDGSSKDRDC